LRYIDLIMGAKGAIMVLWPPFCFLSIPLLSFQSPTIRHFSNSFTSFCRGPLFTSMNLYRVLSPTVGKRFEWENGYEDYLDARF